MMSALERFPDLVLDENKSIRDAMALLNANGREVVLVRDAAGRISGLITDGDIRRGLLGGSTLQSPVTAIIHRDFFAIGPEITRAAVLDLMKARMFRHVPVLDSERRLLAVHFLHDLIGATPKPNIAIVMAGGRGTRLRPMTETVPKPMVTVAGRPILEHIVLHLVGCGVRRIFLSVNYLGHIIEDHFADGSKFGCQIEYLKEDKELGTGGALGLLSAQPAHPFLVLNGDQITRIDIQRLLARHHEAGARATITVGGYQHEVPFGVIHETNGCVTRIEEKPSMTMLVNRGIYVLDPAVLDLVPQGRSFPITELLERLVERGERVVTFFSNDEWLDIGRPADLLKAHGIA